MTTRRLAVISLAAAVLVQTGFVAVYYWLTGGCFCSVTGAPSPPIPPESVLWFLKVAAMPAGWVAGPVPDLLHSALEGVPLLSGWLVMLLAAAVNTVFWALGIFALLYGLVSLSRLRGRTGLGGAGLAWGRNRIQP